MTTTTSEYKEPWLLQQWTRVYRAVPKFHIPFTNLDVSITILAAIFLYCVKLCGEGILETNGWPANDPITKEASASIAAIVHSTTLVPGLWCALRSQPYIPSSKMSEHPQWWQDAVTALLQFCTGYMLYDGLVNIIILRWETGMSPSDWMFLGHHFATSFYMTSSRLIGAGHISALTCMLLGEATNPVHNSFMISQLAKTLDIHNPDSLLVYGIEVLFCTLYIIFRVVLGPVGMLHITYDLVVTERGQKNVPMVLKLMWLIMIWGVVVGSHPWIEECYEMLMKHVQDATSSDKEL
jgi:hypothetical protein